MSICRICKREFAPSKYRPKQKVCSDPKCQHQRQRKNIKDWKRRNPSYFKYKREPLALKEVRRQQARDWRRRNPGYFEQYRQTHREEIRSYMRRYKKKKGGLSRGKEI